MTTQSPITHITAASAAEFSATLSAAMSESGSKNAPLFIHVRGDFCSDCTNTDETVKAAVARLQRPAVFLTALVEDSGAYSSKEYPYRTDDLLKLQGIPTLLRVADGMRLEDKECGDLEKVCEFLGVAGGK